LIGVAGYPSLPAAYRLEGPRNDAALLRDVLARRGFQRENIRVLADGVAGAEEPTRARIMDALDALADKVRRDDFVFVSFSGHGSQQPDDPDSPHRKPDGLSSTILPIDIGRWSGPARTVENAITDHQFGAALDKIRAKGAFVWAVLDSCHSGMMTRGGEVGRSVSPADVGVPPEALQKAAADAAASRSRGVADESEFDIARNPAAHSSGIAGFFAAQSWQEAPEMALPPASAEQKPYGLFTFTLAHLIDQYPHITYAQLDQRILQEYGRLNRSSPTPLALGELTARVFGAQPGPEIRQWPIEIGTGGPEIAAGSVYGLGAGSVLAVLPEPTSDLTAATGRGGFAFRVQGSYFDGQLLDAIGNNAIPLVGLLRIERGNAIGAVGIKHGHINRLIRDIVDLDIDFRRIGVIRVVRSRQAVPACRIPSLRSLPAAAHCHKRPGAATSSHRFRAGRKIGALCPARAWRGPARS
jgi:hypothetical protein